ncbi:hypothetical protein EVAR_75499_1 [Eumeta japonica]|uniref:Uncharacterized protein n=1 Tax=Eumeta variegata TaxID=151549 RepID=A0A4C1TN25_EUMVA|nr:hypothetical protein EVAR_75499_1 [Eumeta japonica]
MKTRITRLRFYRAFWVCRGGQRPSHIFLLTNKRDETSRTDLPCHIFWYERHKPAGGCCDYKIREIQISKSKIATTKSFSKAHKSVRTDTASASSAIKRRLHLRTASRIQGSYGSKRCPYSARQYKVFVTYIQNKTILGQRPAADNRAMRGRRSAAFAIGAAGAAISARVGGGSELLNRSPMKYRHIPHNCSRTRFTVIAYKTALTNSRPRTKVTILFGECASRRPPTEQWPARATVIVRRTSPD